MNKFGLNIKSVKGKIALTITSIIVLMALFVFWYVQIVFKSKSIDSLDKKAKMITTITSSLIAPGLYFNDFEAINNELIIVSRQNVINYIEVVDLKDSVIYCYNKSFPGKRYKSREYQKVDNELSIIFEKSTIEFEEEVLGKILIGASTAEIDIEIAEINKAILLLSFIILGVGIVLAIILSHLITRPLNEVVKTATAIKEGNFNVRANVKSNDEIGVLAVGFNEMVDKLHEFYSKLEDMVKIRTAELAETNHMLEKEIQERIKAEDKIQHSLDEKVTLLKEIHHRIKNNLQIIASLFFLQSEKIEDPQVKSLFFESQERIRSIALVHEKLYTTENFGCVDFPDYVKTFVEKFISIRKGTFIKYEIDIQQFVLSIDEAIPLGLIINEILMNSIKHAFESELFDDNKHEKKIYINGRIDTNQIYLEIGDNGIGFPANFDWTQCSSLGMKLIHGLAHQIDAVVHLESSNGVKYSIKFTLKEKKLT
ncbi:MAG: histidine kinase dimerization/phosphoacceptor domain -containing protein [bacterium]